MKTELFKELVELEAKKTELENSIKTLRENIVVDMSENEVDKVESEFGTFTLVSGRKTWTYSENYKKREAEVEEEIKPLKETIDTLTSELKDIQKKEEKEGIATFVEGSKSLRITK